jgi:hypothetical protein
MKYTVEMGSGAMTYIPSCIKIGSGIQKLIRGGFTDIQDGDLKSVLIFFQNKGYRLNMSYTADLNETHKFFWR